MQMRRRFRQSKTLEQRLAEEAQRLREQAQLLPPGALREEVLRKARQAETGAYMSRTCTQKCATSGFGSGADMPESYGTSPFDP